MISSYPPALRRRLLSKHFLISTLPERALDDLVKFTTVARFEPHRVIFGKGEAGDCLYGILAGRVRIYSTSLDGAEIVLNVMEQGELFGEIALLDGSTRTESAAAMEQTDLLRMVLAEHYRRPQEEEITILLSQHDLGGMVGAGREAINKQLALWRSAGIVDTHRGAIMIRNCEALRALVGCV